MTITHGAHITDCSNMMFAALLTNMFYNFATFSIYIVFI